MLQLCIRRELNRA